MKLNRLVGVAAATAGIRAAAACGGGDTAGTAATGSSSTGGAVTKINYLTSFNTFGRDAYVYVAKEKGYFEEAGLDVDIKPGTGTVDVMKLIASGRADFGPGDFSTVVITVAKEKLPVTTVAMVQQKSLAAIVSLEGYGISSPKDLEGKTIADQPGSTNTVMFPVYAKAAGIDASKVKFVPAAPPTLPQLLAAHKVDAIGQFVVGKGLIEKAAKGKASVFLPFGDVLPDLYGNALLTSTAFAKDKPEVTKKFVAALMKGLEYSIAHPDETGDILKKYQPTQDPKVAAGEVTLMAPYVKGDKGAAIGNVDDARVAKIIEMLTEAGAIPAGLEPSQVVDADVATS
ncbi:MAG TPA: ABC transporter substrate-binding protein [Actinomycetales bacterium]|nr:ABC transporter substrate-binding protein [Actinomycetales bacterium]